MGRTILIILCAVLSPYSFGQHASAIHVKSESFNELIWETDGVLLDVRTTSEFKNGHILNAGQLNFYAFDFRKKLMLLPTDQPIYLYCNTGYRSEKAAKFLIENGYSKVYNLQYGIMEWELKNLPVVVEPDARPDTDNKMDPDQYFAVISSDSLVFIDFYAPWCSPCRKMMPMIDSLKVDYHHEIKVLKVNVDASKKLVKELKLAGVPYLVMFQKGQILFSHNGAIPRHELTSVFEQYINDRNTSMVLSQKAQ